MAKGILEVFQEETKDLKIDEALLKRIHRYERSFVNRNDEHINFFASNLLGVHRLRFLGSDYDMWFDEVVQIDDLELRKKIHSLPTVNPEHSRASDIMNLTCMWLLHAIYNSKLSRSRKHEGMMDTLLVFHYKVLSSKIAHDFKYTANKEVAIATYASLSKKYGLKQYGNWSAWLRARCESVLDRRSIHMPTIEKFRPDEKIQYMITDTQGRVRDAVKNMRNRFQEVMDSDAQFATKAAKVKLEDGDEVRDVRKKTTEYRTYLKGIINDERALIKRELVDIIHSAMHTMDTRNLNDALRYVSKNFGAGGKRHVEEFIDELVVHYFEFVSSSPEVADRRKDLPFVLYKLRGTYMSSRSTDPSLLKLRELGSTIIDDSVRSKSSSSRVSARTGMMLYLVLRMLVKDNYS